MKKFMFFILISIVTISCDDEYYAEGEVETLAVTEITNNSAVLKGTVTVFASGEKAEIVLYGFLLGTTPDNLTSLYDVSKTLSVSTGDMRDFFCTVTNLLPGTKYYIRAYVGIGEVFEGFWNEDNFPNNSYYGNLIEFTTTGDEGGNASPSYVELTAAGIAVQKEDISSSELNWGSAKSLCENSIVGDFTDWRLPTLDELATLYPNRNTIGKFKSSWYWSSVYSGSSFGGYYFINFDNGNQGNTSSSNNCYARCVRIL